MRIRPIEAFRESTGKFGMRKNLVNSNPTLTVVTPKVGKTLPSFVDRGAMEKLLALPDTATFHGSRDSAILELFYGSGIRLSELIGLPMSAIDMHNDTVKVTGKGNKQTSKPR